MDYLLHNYGPRDFVVERAEGSWLWDDKGDKYLDCVTGVAVNALGHRHPAVMAAIEGQLARYVHASNLYLLKPQMELGAALCRAMGFDKAFFCNSGTEANEGAIKFARRHFVKRGDEERIEILSLGPSFHGRTYGSMAATGQEKIKKGFGPLPAGFKTVAAEDPEALRAAAGPRTAAVIFEPIMAEGGIVSLTRETVSALKEIQAGGALLIADEIQTGLGRTGHLLCSRGMGLDPDLVTLAKPLGGGLPLGAVLMKEKVAETVGAGDHGSTFGGNPVACAAGLAVLRVLLGDGFLEDVRARAELLREGLTALIARKAAQGVFLGPPLGKGFLTGFRYGGDLAALQAACRGNGLLVHRAGSDVLRILPPLNISKDEIASLIDRLERSVIK